MKKFKIALLFVFSFVFIFSALPMKETFAASEGLLDGKIFSVGTNAYLQMYTTTKITDGDSKTSEDFSSTNRVMWIDIEKTDIKYYRYTGNKHISVLLYTTDLSTTSAAFSAIPDGVIREIPLSPITQKGITRIGLYAGEGWSASEFNVYSEMPTPTPTVTPSPTPTATPVPTSTPSPTVTPTPTATPTPTVTPKPTATPEQPTGDRAILTITLVNGTEKEYDLPIAEVDAFLKWYDSRDAGRGPGSYAIDKHTNNKGPFSKRKDYVVFDKILTFEVSEYTIQ
ncbi:hypothetical protein [Paenibacillus sp. FSL L8-0323]|uniref:hypothetical protein n=1 Tax=unclassified Paenibacillus TaxID=185978 RepID=UPI0030FC6B5A